MGVTPLPRGEHRLLIAVKRGLGYPTPAATGILGILSPLFSTEVAKAWQPLSPSLLRLVVQYLVWFLRLLSHL